MAGDADYLPTVDQLRARGFTLTVMFYHASRELRESASKFVAMNNFLGYLALKA